MPRYRRHSELVEAIQWTGNNIDEIINFVKKDILFEKGLTGILVIPCQEGDIEVKPNEYIIRDIDNDLYTRHKKIFEKAYKKED